MTFQKMLARSRSFHAAISIGIAYMTESEILMLVEVALAHSHRPLGALESPAGVEGARGSGEGREGPISSEGDRASV